MMASAANRRIRKLSYAKYGYMFILPFFLVYFIFSLYPLIYTFVVSTYRATGTAVDAEMYFVGVENFKDLLFVDSPVRKQFFQAIGNTLILWICNFIPQIALSLLLAVWFTDNRLHVPGKGFFKVVMYMPNIITAASVSVLFLCIFANNGPVNQILGELGVDTIRFGEGTKARPVVMFIQTWMWFGNTMIMLMSGIQGINPSLFEAASIDGASSGQVFTKITLPLLSPIMAYTLVTSMIGGLQMFDIPALYSATVAPDEDLRTVAVLIYEYFHAQMDENKMGLAGAASVILFFITLVLGLISFYITRDKDEIAKKKQRKKIAKQLKQESKQFGGFSI